MSDAIIVALITSAVTLTGVLLSHYTSREDIKSEMKLNQELQKKDIDELKQDVKEHNGYAKMFQESLPVVNEKLKVINHRLDDVENEVKEMRR